MTGDPKRVVAFGLDYAKDQKAIRYSWSNYVAPACDPCNNKYSKLEKRIKPRIDALLHGGTLTVVDYVELLDWLDKVRVGIWFIRHMIENHPSTISPNFHIDTRIAQKDRMVAVYIFESENKGISLFGTESPVFNEMPSCFGIRINNILLINASSEFFCSLGCGFPHPATMKVQMGGNQSGKLIVDNFQRLAGIKYPSRSFGFLSPLCGCTSRLRCPAPAQSSWKDFKVTSTYSIQG